MSKLAKENLKKVEVSDDMKEYFEMLEGLANNGIVIKNTEDSVEQLCERINNIVTNYLLDRTWVLVFSPAGVWVEINGKPRSRVYSFSKKALLDCIGRLELKKWWRDNQWKPVGEI